MIVCIVEKSSVTRDIADIPGARDRRDGYTEGNGYQATWTFGHLYILKEPHEYTPNWKSWSLGSLPVVPPRFGIKLISNPTHERQFYAIENLMQHVDVVINCGDVGQEGELIQHWVMQKAGVRCPVKRLWISSLTEETIREGLAKLRDASDFQPLYEAGLLCATGDRLLGMNVTRLYTMKYGQNRQVLSVGRAQTPTFASVANRQLEVQNFVPKQYQELKMVYHDTTFSVIPCKSDEELVLEAEKQKEGAAAKAAKSEESRGIEPITDRGRGTTLLEQIRNALFMITNVTRKNGRETPLRLFDLTSLQVECNKKSVFSADEMLKTTQSLYEKRVTIYPRVDTTFLSDDIYPKRPDILKGLRDYQTSTAPLEGTTLLRSKKVFDNSKVTDHHAIIPIGQPLQNLTDMERRVFDLIARRFIAVFYPDRLFVTTTIIGEAEQIEFKVSGKQILESGWRVVFDIPSAQFQEEKDEKGGEEENVFLVFAVGESGPHLSDLYEEWTQLPRPYTETTLLCAMEATGKPVDNDGLRDASKENGIGRPSTRAATIETLFKRSYTRKEKKDLIATPIGVELVQIIHEELLKSAELTGIWEKKLREMEKRTYNAGQFLEELKQMVSEIVMSVLSDNSNRHITIQVPAPEKGGKNSASSASASDEPKKEPKKRVPRKSAVKKAETAMTDSLPVAAEQPASVVQADELVGQPCPLCGKGTVTKGKMVYGRSEQKSGCTSHKPSQ